MLTGVQGVGAKVALAILSALSANDLAVAVATCDSKAFTKASGVGPKLGVRLITELKGKAVAVGVPLDMPANMSDLSVGSSVVQEAISALINLGYGRSEAGIVVGAVYKENDGIGISDLIRLSLKEIGKKNG